MKPMGSDPRIATVEQNCRKLDGKVAQLEEKVKRQELLLVQSVTRISELEAKLTRNAIK